MSKKKQTKRNKAYQPKRSIAEQLTLEAIQQFVEGAPVTEDRVAFFRPALDAVVPSIIRHCNALQHVNEISPLVYLLNKDGDSWDIKAASNAHPVYGFTDTDTVLEMLKREAEFYAGHIVLYVLQVAEPDGRYIRCFLLTHAQHEQPIAALCASEGKNFILNFISTDTDFIRCAIGDALQRIPLAFKPGYFTGRAEVAIKALQALADEAPELSADEFLADWLKAESRRFIDMGLRDALWVIDSIGTETDELVKRLTTECEAAKQKDQKTFSRQLKEQAAKQECIELASRGYLARAERSETELRELRAASQPAVLVKSTSLPEALDALYAE